MATETGAGMPQVCYFITLLVLLSHKLLGLLDIVLESAST